MIRYLLELMAFQGLFLLAYDLFLRRETFFQWNRCYLLGTSLLSVILPLIRIDAFREMAPQSLVRMGTPVYRLDAITVSAEGVAGSQLSLPWMYLGYSIGATLALAVFLYKLYQVFYMKRKGRIRRFPDYTRVLVPDSTVACSFFRNIFIGASLSKRFRREVTEHELVHVKQRHSWDLMYLELLRLVFWFNPLLYLFQRRLSELHEYIADRQVTPGRRRIQLDYLLSSAFGLRGSFLNYFSKNSLIKKRIVMLQKTPTSENRKWKYALLLPLLCLILAYTSCQDEGTQENEVTLQVADVENLSPDTEQEIFARLKALSSAHSNWTFTVTDGKATLLFREASEGSYISGPNGEHIPARIEMQGVFAKYPESFPMGREDGPQPFSLVEIPPVFPACEGNEDIRTCFNQQMLHHIRKNFRYPETAIAEKLEGRVNLLFAIGKDGIITEIKSRGPHKILQDEAERIISRLPQMGPGRQNGKSVKVYYSIPITFKLSA